MFVRLVPAAVAVSALLIAGCSPPATTTNTSADLNAAAERGQQNVDNYAAGATKPAATTPAPAPAATPVKEVPLEPAEPGQPGGLPDDKTPIAETPAQPGSAQEAATVVETYYGLLGQRKFRQAWALWRDKGAGSGQSADAFAAEFGAYKEYHANVGAPGRVDAGAGQRYVTVPVQVYARQGDGKPAYWRGDVILHRTGDIDGATAEQKMWRIDRIDIKPAPGKAHDKPRP
jgi:outer membrane murein-binding lipoprotein Lpp